MEKDEKEGRVRRRKEKRKHLQSRTILFRFDAYVTNSLKKKQNLLYRIIVTTATNDLYSSWVSVSVVQELTAMSEIFSLVLRTHIKKATIAYKSSSVEFEALLWPPWHLCALPL